MLRAVMMGHRPLRGEEEQGRGEEEGAVVSWVEKEANIIAMMI